MYRRILIFLLAGACPALLALEPITAGLHYSYPMQPGAQLTVHNSNGSIQISGWDQHVIDITATKSAETQELLDQIKVDISTDASGVHIGTILPESAHGGVKYVIKAPRGIQLAEIRSSNGSIRVDEIDGAANLQTSNGSVHATKARGKLDIQTSNGSVEVQDVEGETSVHTSNGSVHGSAIRGPLTASTSNGGMRVDLEDARGGPVILSTSNGGITVRMPASFGAHVKAVTSSNSRVSSDFEVRTEGDNSKSHLEGTIGAGGPTVELKTSQGAIHLLKL